MKKHNFKINDQVKWYGNDSLVRPVRYATVIKINKVSVKIRLEDGEVLNVKPETLNFD